MLDQNMVCQMLHQVQLSTWEGSAHLKFAHFYHCVFIFWQPCDQFLMMGTYQGEVKMFNLHTGSVSVNNVYIEIPVLRFHVFKNFLYTFSASKHLK
jgi:hypothetical protein